MCLERNGTTPEPLCPHCGNPSSVEHQAGEHRHCCQSCGAAGPYADSPAVAARLFTNRVRLTGWKTGEYRDYPYKEGRR